MPLGHNGPSEHALSDAVAVIIAGGSGTRFWPLSTPRRPKQFLRLFGERTMLQHTFDRLRRLVPAERVLVLTAERFVPLVLEQLPQLPKANVIGEPAGRDTAAAVALAATLCRARFGNPTMIVLPADHMIEPVEAFEEAVATAVEAARAEEALYTFGVPPTYPATGYGYLEAGRRLTGETDRTAVERYQVLRFREKPSYSVAKEYVASGRYYWNSGMFVWTVDAIMREIERHLPEHARLLFPLGEEWGSPAWNRRLRDAFPRVPKISIDFGVMEKAERVSMVKAPFRWSDVGGWTALSAFLRRDAATNAVRGQVYGLDAQDNIVYCADEREQVALVGVKDLVVVRAGSRTLVAHKEKVEEVKKLVETINAQDAQGKGRWAADVHGGGTAAVV
ncbi:MAG TPA: sugar phosphate nucleotidyltransferase [Limnochordia bacterium]|nr:sugar phosphate nucleotidyltransferase [Limnochordia bacterium]